MSPRKRRSLVNKAENAEKRGPDLERRAAKVKARKKVNRPVRAWGRVTVDDGSTAFTEEVAGSQAFVKQVTGRAENKYAAGVALALGVAWLGPKVVQWVAKQVRQPPAR